LLNLFFDLTILLFLSPYLQYQNFNSDYNTVADAPTFS